jgi:EAL domain-containing protein (putative c-di-GMP-specific phosphodiesterase class I)
MRELGCDAVQGNFFCHPLPARDIPEVPSNLALMAH